jgi:predicted DNA-binding antitoxin AbrB/MazE fold protein
MGKSALRGTEDWVAREGEEPMAVAVGTTIEAVYEDGVLKPKEKLDLEEGEEVRVEVTVLMSEGELEEFLRRNPCFRPEPCPGAPTDLSRTVDEYLYGPLESSDE